MGRDFIEMRRRRVFHVIRADADLSNAFAGSDSEVNFSAEHRRRRLFPQVRRMGGGQFLRSNTETFLFCLHETISSR